MSADLLAEFDSFYQKPKSDEPVAQPPLRPQFQEMASSDFFAQGSFRAQDLTNSRNVAPVRSSVTQGAGNGDKSWGDFSAFGIGASSTIKEPSPTYPDADDGWGDFETAESQNHAALSTQSNAEASEPSPTVKPRIMRASTFDLMSNNIPDFSTTSYLPEPSNTARLKALPASQQNSLPSREQVKKADPNVLFDADDFDGQELDDDDFGDFETGQSHAQSPPQVQSQPSLPKFEQPKQRVMPPSLDLLSLNDPAPQWASRTSGSHMPSLSTTSISSPYPQGPKSPSFSERNPFPGLALKTPTSPSFPQDVKKGHPGSPSPITAWPTVDSGSTHNQGTKARAAANVGTNDDWSPFADSPGGWHSPKKVNESKATEISDGFDSWDWDAADIPQPIATELASTTVSTLTATVSDAHDDDTPPTNIPPPSVLLSIFPQLLDLANNSLFKPLVGQPTVIKDRVISDPSTIDCLRGYLLIATVAARVIAGRKLRWHRDKFLSRGMAISAAGAKGMKLAGVDRAQSAREDREAADVAFSWKEQVGRLRSAVAAANATTTNQGGAQLKVPELGENMTVTTAKVVPTAPKPCIVCGLKRDERVAKVDVNVEDSFGEWWVDHWGHRTCKNFWIEHEKQLRSK